MLARAIKSVGMRLQSGSHLGPYEIVAAIGVGGGGRRRDSKNCDVLPSGCKWDS